MRMLLVGGSMVFDVTVNMDVLMKLLWLLRLPAAAAARWLLLLLLLRLLLLRLLL